MFLGGDICSEQRAGWEQAGWKRVAVCLRGVSTLPLQTRCWQSVNSGQNFRYRIASCQALVLVVRQDLSEHQVLRKFGAVNFGDYSFGLPRSEAALSHPCAVGDGGAAR